MKKYLFLMLAMMFVFMPMQAKKQKAKFDFNYEIECAGNGVNGTYLVKVWSYTKDLKKAKELSKKNAVHGVIFKGYVGTNGCVGQHPLAANPGVEAQFQEYFDLFFQDGGEYMKYVQLTATPETLKVGKMYKVGVVVSVSKDALRKTLEAAGVCKSLNYGF